MENTNKNKQEKLTKAFLDFSNKSIDDLTAAQEDFLLEQARENLLEKENIIDNELAEARFNILLQEGLVKLEDF